MPDVPVVADVPGVPEVPDLPVVPEVPEAPGGARVVAVPLARLPAWVAGFARRHGPASGGPDPRGWRLVAADGAVAVVAPPAWWALLPRGSAGTTGLTPEALAGLAPDFGIVLVRRAGYAVARVRGRQLLARKVGSRHVNGRTAAGGWSQKRYARRRAHQAEEVAGATAAAVARLLVPDGTDGDWAPAFLVTGGERSLLREVLELSRASVGSLPVAGSVAVGTPTADVLAGVPDRVLQVLVTLDEPTGVHRS